MNIPNTDTERARRPYNSPLRAEHVDRTRARILEAVVEQIEALEEISIPRVAQRAGVSAPTVYRHFPDKQALIRALTEYVDQKLALQTVPRRIDEFDQFVPRLFSTFDEHETLVRARLISRVLRQIHRATQRRRAGAITRAMAEVTAGLDPEDARRACAVVRVLVSGNAWEMMRDSWDLNGKDAGEAVAWAVRVLVAELRRNPNSMKPGDPPPGDRFPIARRGFPRR